ncbi:MAG: SHD1 domain-containing protein, partial [Planctomycetota bacterium]|nr:SHD1 domain-containing protein [Planctomycetota bacterium]
LLVGLLVTAAPVSARKWTSSDGKFSIEAELVEAKDGNVRLKRQDGKVITVPVSQLSKADRDYLSSIAKPEKKPEAAKPTPAEAIAAIKKLGGSVKVDGNKAVVSVDLNFTKITTCCCRHGKADRAMSSAQV